MKPEIRLYFDFEFTSLSPDAMPISLGIVSEEIANLDGLNKTTFEYLFGKIASNTHSKSFYSEFLDFDINRCDDWVKENVVSKLKMLEFPQELGFKNENTLKLLNSGIGSVSVSTSNNDTKCTGATSLIKKELGKWLSQFSEYNIQFVCDCGTFDWYWMLQLLAEWEIKILKQKTKELHEILGSESMAFGLPKLPSNISPVPEDLNDLIAHKYQIGVRGAFNTNREELAFCDSANEAMEGNWKAGEEKHNSLFDARVIKAIYEKLK